MGSAFLRGSLNQTLLAESLLFCGPQPLDEGVLEPCTLRTGHRETRGAASHGGRAHFFNQRAFPRLEQSDPPPAGQSSPRRVFSNSPSEAALVASRSLGPDSQFPPPGPGLAFAQTCFATALAAPGCWGHMPRVSAAPRSPCTVFTSPRGWRLAWRLSDGNTEDSLADLRNVRTGLGKSAVFVVWGFEASFTTDLPRTRSSQMRSPPGGPSSLLVVVLTRRLAGSLWGGGGAARAGAALPDLLQSLPSFSGERAQALRRSHFGDSCGFHFILQWRERCPLDTHSPILEIFPRCLWGSCALKPSFVGT